MSEYCLDDETEEDLQRGGLRILQKKNGFRFGLDTVLLSSFARVRPGERVLDMCSGCGVIPILLLAKTEGRDFTGLELMPDMADMAARSVKMNGLEDRIHMINGDCREAGQLFGEASFDVVTCNPPYLKGGGPVSEDTEKAAARHEIYLSLSELAGQTFRVLKPHGRLYMVHRPERLAEILSTLSGSRLEPKHLRFVFPDREKDASLILIEAVKNAGAGLKVEPPLFVYAAPGEYSDEVAEAYGPGQG